MAYSVQQIKFELVSYIKEFGGESSAWRVGTAEDAPKVLFEIYEVDPVEDIWLWKPALTPSAADMVSRWIVDRQKALPADKDIRGNCVFLFRRNASGKQ